MRHQRIKTLKTYWQPNRKWKSIWSRKRTGKMCDKSCTKFQYRKILRKKNRQRPELQAKTTQAVSIWIHNTSCQMKMSKFQKNRKRYKIQIKILKRAKISTLKIQNHSSNMCSIRSRKSRSHPSIRIRVWEWKSAPNLPKGSDKFKIWNFQTVTESLIVRVKIFKTRRLLQSSQFDSIVHENVNNKIWIGRISRY